MKTIIVLGALALTAILILGVAFVVKIAQVPYSMLTSEHGKATMINMSRNAVPVPLESTKEASGGREAVSLAWLTPPSRLDGAPALPAPPALLPRQQ